jgi:head-tail adaptor
MDESDMRAGNLFNRIKFYAKVTTRDAYGSSVDSWPIATITTRGEVRWQGGSRLLLNEEKSYSKSMELTVRYRSAITETMKVQIDGTSDLFLITYLEIIGRKEALRLTLEKDVDGIAVTATNPPTGFTATPSGADHHRVDLAWTNNAADDGVVIERSTNGNDWTEIIRIAKNVIPVTAYINTGLTPSTRYFYRIKAFLYNNYSAFAAVDDATTIA